MLDALRSSGRAFALLLLGCGLASAQSPLTFYVHDTTGANPDSALPNPYTFAATEVHSYSPVTVKAVNTSFSTLLLGTAIASTSSSNTTPSSHYTVTNVLESQILAPGASTTFVVNFTPQTTGSLTAYLRVIYQTETGGCSLRSHDPAEQCTGSVDTVTELDGTGSTAAFVITYQSSTNGNPLPSGAVLQPATETRLQFGNVATSNSATITFSITNPGGSTAAVPAIYLATQLNVISPFALDVSGVPTTLAAGASADFTITFGPGQLGLWTSILYVAKVPYGIEGVGVAIATIDSLQISYITPTGVLVKPQGATPIQFGQVVDGSGGSVIYAFTATNPSASYNSVTVPTLTVTGTGFTLGGGPSLPVTLAPGDSITWSVTFTPSGVGTYTGTLTLGTRAFSLGGLSAASSLPAFTMQLATHPPISHLLPDNLNITFVSPVSATYNGTLTMTFTPSVSGIADDPTVAFAAGGRTLTVNIASGDTQAKYSGSVNIGVNTGTTAGTITLTLTWPSQLPQVQSFTVSPAPLTITSTNAVWASPNLVVTTVGYDNTYSASSVTYTFFDSSHHQIGSPVTTDISSYMHGLFYDPSNTQGGTFSLTATFPVTGGPVTGVASVSYVMTNSAGTTAGSGTFH